MRMQKALAGLAGATAVLAACGGAVAHARTGGTEATKAPLRVTVSEREFRLTLSTTKLKPGPVLFVVRNRGTFPHALEVEGTGLPERRTRTLAPGASATLRVTLKAGKLELYCRSRTTVSSACSRSCASAARRPRAPPTTRAARTGTAAAAPAEAAATTRSRRGTRSGRRGRRARSRTRR